MRCGKSGYFVLCLNDNEGLKEPINRLLNQITILIRYFGFEEKNKTVISQTS